MTQTVGDEVGTLRAAMEGAALLPGDADYDQARKVWNAEIDRRPAVIARCLTAEDVASAVRFGVQRGLEISVRGGAHGAAGKAVVDGGLMIELSRLNHVHVDPEARTARVGGGALLLDVLAATQEHGLATTVGMVAHTGVGGLTLGGGMGWLSRKHGLSIDNMLSAQVVTADGRILRASHDDNPDLFWAIRGGGGNFGVVTEFEFALHPVGPMIHFGIVFWSLDQGAAVLRHAREVVGSLPDETNVVIGALNAPPMPFVPEEMHFTPGYAAIVAGFGSEAEHQDVVSRLRAAAPPMFEFATPMPYMALSTMLDEANAWGFHYYDKACYVEDLSDDVIDVLTEHVPRKSSPMSIALFFRLDNAYSAVGEDATAFSGGRSPRYNLFTIAAA
ncbi:MAG TPA: FAD-binding oxidoreductase, partial [Mycobacteriales bacterium]|nr:FAD-binding oxidoreductase [Mycobacteriales bacterium]